jgi:hypothetical protein
LQQSAFKREAAYAVRPVLFPPLAEVALVSTSSSASDVAAWLPTFDVPVLSTNSIPESVVAALSCVVCSSCAVAEMPGRVSASESKSTAKSWSCPVTSSRACGASTWP